MSLPYYRRFGWDPVVLAVEPRHRPDWQDESLLAGLPSDVPVHYTSALPLGLTRAFGIQNMGLRCAPFINRVGRHLLRREKFDLVFFSTTQYLVTPLGRVWQRETGVPYVIDLQDPWLSDYYQQPGAPKPPGGWKYHFAHALARIMEGWTMRHAAHVISVSERYLTVLGQRYAWFEAARGSVLTFGSPDLDYVIARRQVASSPAILPPVPGFKIAYAGRLGPDMAPALDVLFAAVARFKDSPRPFELFFFGTSYAPAGAGVSSTGELAKRHGIEHLVHEQTARTGYISSLRIMLEADLTLLLGSDDKAYSPSKMYPTLVAGRPTIAVAPAHSVLEDRIADLGGAALTTFDPSPASGTPAVDHLSATLAGFTAQPEQRLGAPARLDVLEREYSAAAIARRQLEIFNVLINRSRTAPPPMAATEYWPTPPPSAT